MLTDGNSHPPILDYAPPEPRKSLWTRRREIPGELRALFWAGFSFVAGVYLGDDMGSGRVILNPITYTLAGVFLIAVSAYIILRIQRDSGLPRFCLFLMTMSALAALPALLVVYACWNRKHQIPPRWNEDFWYSLYWIIICIAVFSVTRAFGKWVVARRQLPRERQLLFQALQRSMSRKK